MTPEQISHAIGELARHCASRSEAGGLQIAQGMAFCTFRNAAGEPDDLPELALQLAMHLPASFLPLTMERAADGRVTISTAGIPIEPVSKRGPPIDCRARDLMKLEDAVSVFDRGASESDAYWVTREGRKEGVNGTEVIHGRSPHDIACKLALAAGVPFDGDLSFAAECLVDAIEMNRIGLRKMHDWSEYDIAAAAQAAVTDFRRLEEDPGPVFDPY